MPEADLQTCPSCGEPVTTVVGGLCPRCLIGNALGDPTDVDGDTEGTLSDRTADPPAVDGSPAGAPAPADRSAHLELSDEIGRGGMGVVLRARDLDLGRELAVKVLRDDLRHSPEMVHRFLEEAQIAGQLQHPGIVPVHELGTLPDQRPYFTMKLVKGRTLSRLLDDERTSDAGRARLLGIFEQVCQTVAYAHAHGVIHRDLKPSNVMVGSFGEVQVMDWGLAKVLRRGGSAGDDSDRRPETPAPGTVIATARSLSDSDLSSAGSVLGTPSYMAPEQARGEVEAIDERVDVFALGSILCEILSGQPAFTGARGVDIQRRAADGDLSDAWLRLGGCGADAELVSLARDCLSAEREGRPRDAGVVAGRLTAYLAGVQERLRAAEVAHAAESARAEEATRTAEVARAQTRAERRARRLTAVLAAAGVSLVASIGGGAAWLQRQGALQAATTLRLVDEALDRARQREAEARAGAATDPTHWEAALAEARRAEALLQQGRADAALRGRVAAALAALGRRRDEAAALADRLKVDRKLLADLEAARYGSRPLRELDDPPGGALAPQESLADGDDLALIDERYRAAFLAAGLDVDGNEPERVGAWIASRSAPAELTAYLDGWVFVRRRNKPVPGRRDWTHLNTAARAADHDPWRDKLRAALDDQRALQALADDEPGLEKQPVLSLNVLSIYVHDRQRAERVSRIAWRKQPGDFWINSQLADLMGEKRTGSAEQVALRRQARLRYLTAAATARPSSVPAITRLGDALLNDGRFEETLDCYRRAIQLRPDADSYRYLAKFFSRQKRFGEAADTYRTAIRLQPNNASAHFEFAHSLKEQDQPQAAEGEYREALRLEPGNPLMRCYFGWALEGWKRRDEAIVQFREAVRLDAARGHVGSAASSLVKNLNLAGRYDEAIAAAREIIRIKPDANGPYQMLVDSLWRKGPPDAVAGEYRKGLPEPHPALADEVLGKFMTQRQRWDDAADALRRAQRLQPDSVEANRSLGDLLAQKGEWVEALKSLNRAADLGRADESLGLRIAVLSLYVGDDAGFRRRCLAMLDHPDLKAADPSLSRIRRTCKACLLGPRPVEPERASRLLEQAFAGAMAKNAGAANDVFSHLVLGMVEYRRGRFAQAVVHLEKCRRMTASQQHQADLMLAMSYDHLGRKDDARRLISASRGTIRKSVSGPPYGGGGSWPDWLTCAPFLREAEALISDEPARRAEGPAPGPPGTGAGSPARPASGSKP